MFDSCCLSSHPPPSLVASCKRHGILLVAARHKLALDTVLHIATYQRAERFSVASASRNAICGARTSLAIHICGLLPFSSWCSAGHKQYKFLGKTSNLTVRDAPLISLGWMENAAVPDWLPSTEVYMKLWGLGRSRLHPAKHDAAIDSPLV